MKKIICKIIFFVALILSFCIADASTISSIDTVATINENGDMYVTQIWDTYSDDGTEWYIPMNNLKDIKLLNFAVSEIAYGKEIAYEFVKDWNVNASIVDKAYKYTDFYNKKSKKRELCFGKGEYGKKKYKLTWIYKNAVVKYADNQTGFHIKFVNDSMSPAPKSVSVRLSLVNGDKKVNLSAENAKIWAFGYDGDVIFDKGDIYAYSKSSSINFVSILSQIDNSFFKSLYKSNITFDKQRKIAFKGSSYSDNTFFKRFLYKNLYFLFFVAPFIVNFVFRKVCGIKSIYFRNKFSNISRRELKEIKSTKYKRQIPLKGNIQEIQGLLELSRFKKFERENLIDALLLRLVKNDFIDISDESLDKVIKPCIRFKDKYKGFAKRTVLTDIIDVYYKAKNEQNEVRSFNIDDKMVHSKINKLLKYDDFYEALTMLKENNYIDWHSDDDITASVDITNKGVSALKEIYGLYNYLTDFTLINERGVQDVHLWDEYLIMASLFGCSEELAKELVKINPKYKFYKDEIQILPTDMVVCSRHYTRYSSGTMSLSQMENSFGYGGNSSFGGGGGSSGGGSGGGSR